MAAGATLMGVPPTPPFLAAFFRARPRFLLHSPTCIETHIESDYFAPPFLTHGFHTYKLSHQEVEEWTHSLNHASPSSHQLGPD
jgi:hypothetical protein